MTILEEKSFYWWLNEKDITVDDLKSILTKISDFLNVNKNYIATQSSEYLVHKLKEEYSKAGISFSIDSYTKMSISIDIISGIESYCKMLSTIFSLYHSKKRKDSDDRFIIWQKTVMVPKIESAYKLYNKSNIDLSTGNIVSVPKNAVFSDSRIVSSLLRILNDYDGYRYIDFYECI